MLIFLSIKLSISCFVLGLGVLSIFLTFDKANHSENEYSSSLSKAKGCPIAKVASIFSLIFSMICC